MTKALSRKFRGHDNDMRDSARSEARKSENGLGDWLDDAIRENGREEEVDGADEDRVDAVARRLARPAGEGEAGRREGDDQRQRRRWRDAAMPSAALRARERDDDEDDRRESRGKSEKSSIEARYERGRDSWRDEERLDPEEIVSDAAAIVERRVAESERHTARAFETLADLIKRGNRRGETAEEGLAFLAERLGRIESRLAEQPAGATVKPIRSALARLESRIDRLSTLERPVDVEQAAPGLGRRPDDVSPGLDSGARVPGADLASVSPAALEQGLRRTEPLTRRPLADAIAEITQRQRVLDETATTPEAGVSRPAPSDPPVSAPPAPGPDIWAGEPPVRRFTALQASIDALTRQLDSVRQDAGERGDQQMVAMRQIEGLRREVEDISRAIGNLAPRASVAAVETALRDLAHRVDIQRHRGVSDELLAPAERVAGELRAVIRDLDPSPIVRNLHADVLTIGRRLDAMQQPNAADESAIRQLAAQTREIREQLSALASRPLPIERIETRLFDLTQRVDALAHAGAGSAKAAAALDMGELARSIRSIVAAESNPSIDTFNRRLEQLATKLDEAVIKTGAKRFDELGQRIDELDRKLSRDAVEGAVAQKSADTASLENLIANLAVKIDAALDSRPRHAGVEEIGRKIERLETRLASPVAGFEEIGRKIEKLENRINDPVASESIARIEAMLQTPPADHHFAELAQRIDFVRETLSQRLDQGVAAAPAADMRHIEEIVRGLDQKVDAALAATSKADVDAIRTQLDALYAKVDRLEDASVNSRLGAMLSEPRHNEQLDGIAASLERMQAALSKRAEESDRVQARQNDLAALVEQLADRMNQALDPRADSEALKALEAQIGVLSQRLDGDDSNGAALAGVEARIAALVGQMEETKAATTLAAEEAVRRATQDILRQANPLPGALREALERELLDIRKIQDESGQRTHETLLAVHETLERVVDRLAIFEDELTEIRSAPRAAPAVEPALRARASEPAVEPRAPRAEGEGEAEYFLVPPGGLPTPRREPGFSAAQTPRADAIQTDFIAAARRAAQQAAMDAEAAERAHLARRSAAQNGAAPDLRKPDRAATLEDRKRPLLLGLAGVVLLAGAFGLTRMALQGHGDSEHQLTEAAPSETQPATAAKTGPAETSKETAPAATPAPSQTPAAAPEAPRASPPPRMIAPHAETAPVDSTPVGSIGNLNPLSAPDAVNVIKSLALQGDPTAQYELAIRFADGRGVGRDAKVAAQWFEKAAAQGLAPAQYRLGSFYEKGVGVERDYARAKKYYQSAAEAGNARAMHNLAVLLAEGGDGGKPDYAAASEWFRKAAEYGVRDSQYNLAILYARGLGVPQSLPESYLWFSAAADQGDADAGKKRDEVASRLDSKDLATAKLMAAAFKAKEPRREANEVAPPKGGWESVKDPSAGAAKPPGSPVPKAPSKAKVSAL